MKRTPMIREASASRESAGGGVVTPTDRTRAEATLLAFTTLPPMRLRGIRAVIAWGHA